MYSAPPRILCCEIRTFIIVLSVIAIFGNTVTILGRGRDMKIASACSLILELITLYGAVKNNSRALKIALIISVVNAVFVFISLLVVPVLLSSRIASGYGSPESINGSIPEADTVEPSDKRAFMFFTGLTVGYITEVIFSITLLLSIAKYVLIDRIYMYAKSLECGDIKGPQVA